MSRQPPLLPDINDDELKRRLAPLTASILPAGAPRLPTASPAPAPAPAAEPPAIVQAPPPPVIVAAPPTPAPAARPPRKGIEFLLPERVVGEIKMRAAQRGISATILLLELLRDAGYPVVEADFTDLRKAPRR
jgi:hypothetical protein